MFRIAPNPDRRFEYMIAAGWSDGAVLKTPQAFRDYVVAAAREYNSPIRVAGAAVQRRAP
jgi:hypothetical protein